MNFGILEAAIQELQAFNNRKKEAGQKPYPEVSRAIKTMQHLIDANISPVERDIKRGSKVRVKGAVYYVMAVKRRAGGVSLSLPKKDGSQPVRTIYCPEVGYFTTFSEIDEVL